MQQEGLDTQRYDVVIVGGGPAGLSAATFLGRCCRRVLLCDAGAARNTWSRAMHCFLTRDGISPVELRSLARAEIARYETVTVRDVEVKDARGFEGGFEVTLEGGAQVTARRLLLATGLVDSLPPIPGLAERWGRGAYPCPYCDAWEFRGRPLGVLGQGDSAVALCRALTTWSPDVVMFCDGPGAHGDEDERALAGNGVRVLRERVRALEGEGGALRIVLEGVDPVERAALFVSGPQQQRSSLVTRLGCQVNAKGVVETGLHESTNVPGMFVAGDASDNVQFAIVAAAEGTEAAFEINRSLVREDFARKAEAATPGPM